MKWFDQELKTAQYLVLTDDVQRVKKWNLHEHTANKLVLLHDLNCSLSTESHNTMMELSILFNHCDHLLLTVGTFSYWAGWKSVGHVLASSIQMYSFKNKGTAYTKAEEEDFFPPNFRLIKQCDGEVDKFCTVTDPRDPTWNNWKLALLEKK